jgi:hypothetical protein
MNKEQLARLLRDNHGQFFHQLKSLSDADFCYAPEGKWSAAQHLDHIYRSVAPVNLALWIPKFLIRRKFGVANRPSKTYEALIEKYKSKLADGGKAIGPFVPEIVTADKKVVLLRRVNRVLGKLMNKTVRHSEESLDKYILPHPLLGKITLREMLYFTAYHVQHHHELVQKGLDKMNIE